MRKRKKRKQTGEYTASLSKTFAYSAIFKYPLSFYQLCTYLIEPPTKKLNYKTIKKDLDRLVKKRKVRHKNGKYSFPSRKTVAWKKRGDTSQQLLERNRKVFDVLKSIPWIKTVGVTGSVAAYNAQRNSDIDIFIITAKNRVWITRGFMFVILKILNKYPQKGMDTDKLCPNILLDEGDLEWPKEYQNMFTAHEIVFMQPLVDKKESYFRFISKNKWISKYIRFTSHIPKSDFRVRKGSLIVNLVDNLAMKIQLNYMKRRKTKEITTKNFIHFNKKDDSIEILDRYKEKSERLLLTN